jgi:hypothetical protein
MGLPYKNTVYFKEMKPNIYFKTPKCAGTSIVSALRQLNILSVHHYNLDKIGDNGFAMVRYQRCGDDFMGAVGEWEGDFEKVAYKWTVCRNPYERTVSAYHYMQRCGYFSKRHSFTDWVNVLYAYYWTPPDGKLTVSMLARPHATMDLFWGMTRDMCDCPDPGMRKNAANTGEGCDCFMACSGHADPWQNSRLFVIASTPEDFAAKRDLKLIPRQLDMVIRFEALQEGFDEVCDDVEIPRIELPHSNKSPSFSTSQNYADLYSPREIEMISEIYAYEIKRFGYKFDE